MQTMSQRNQEDPQFLMSYLGEVVNIILVLLLFYTQKIFNNYSSINKFRIEV